MDSESVVQDVAERLPSTIELALVAFVAVALLGALAGFVRARVRAPVLREVLSVPPLLGRAMPVVILALFFQLGMMVTGLPVAGASSSDAFDLRDQLLHLVAPVLCLAVPFAAWSSLIFFDFFRAPNGTARVRVRSLLAPLASTAASIGPALLATSLLFVEPRFAWPGIGRLLYNGLGEFEFGLVATCLLVYAVGVMVMKLCGRLAPAMIDGVPRGSEAPQAPTRRRSRISVLAAVALVVLLVAIVGALGADVIAPIGPYFIDQEHWQGYPLAPGTFGHVLGTEENGRDLLARLLVALRFSLGIAAFAALLAAAIAALVAKVASALPWFDGRSAPGTAGIRPFAALPFIMAAIMALVAALNNVRFLTPAFIALAIAVVSWPAIVSAFRRFGRARLASVVDVGACALLLEVTLSSHGWGVQPPAPSLGNMLANAQSNVTVAPWAAIIPSAVTVVVLFALYALGDELRERARAVR
jgi:peptide/nickel transport system permease protein